MPRSISVGNCSFDVEMGEHRRFWKRVLRGEWEPETFEIFDKFIEAETLFVDIGAWIGATALYGVQRADRCIAFEPDPVAFAALQENVHANVDKDWVKRLEINDCAINKDGASFVLGGSAAGADSTSSALFPNRESQWTVKAKSLRDVLDANRRPRKPVFIKIDIEGGEYDLLPTVQDVLADHLVTAFISFHPNMLRKSLSVANSPERAQEIFVERHLAVIETLPWSRSITSRNGTAVDRSALEAGVKLSSHFPAEILVSGL